MRHNTPQMVTLNSGEQNLLDQITFGFGHGDDKIISESCKAAAILTPLLLQREEILRLESVFL